MLLKTETHIHKSRTVARRAAEDAGLNLDDLVIYQAEGKWGWMDADTHVKACDAKAADGTRKRKQRKADTDAPAADATGGGAVVLVGGDVPGGELLPALFDAGDLSIRDDVVLDIPPASLSEPVIGDITEPVADADEAATEVDPVMGEALPPAAEDTGDYQPEPTAQGGDVSNVVPLGSLPQPETEVVVQIATKMLPIAGRSLAEQLLKRYGFTVLIRDAETLELRDTVAPKVKVKASSTANGPHLVRDWSVRPVINSKHHLHVEKILDRIDDAKGNVIELEHIATTFKPSCTYYKMAHRYLLAWLEAAREAEAAGETEQPPGEDVTDGHGLLQLADAAD